MARIRTIKPEFFTSEQVVECSPTARLLFVGMWCFCDDRGVHPASIRRLKMEVFPGDGMSDSTVQKLVDELLHAGLLVHFESELKCWWAVTGWHHQKIDKPNFRYPSPPAPLPVADHSTNGSRPVADHSPPEGSLRESSLEESKGAPPNPPLGGGEDFSRFLSAYPKSGGIVVGGEQCRPLFEALSPADRNAVVDAAKNYADSCRDDDFRPRKAPRFFAVDRQTDAPFWRQYAAEADAEAASSADEWARLKSRRKAVQS